MRVENFRWAPEEAQTHQYWAYTSHLRGAPPAKQEREQLPQVDHIRGRVFP